MKTLILAQGLFLGFVWISTAQASPTPVPTLTLVSPSAGVGAASTSDSSGSSTSTLTSVQVPCLDSTEAKLPRLDLQPCSMVLSDHLSKASDSSSSSSSGSSASSGSTSTGTSGSVSTSSPVQIPGLVTVLSNHIKQRVDCYYRGRSIPFDVINLSASDAAKAAKDACSIGSDLFKNIPPSDRQVCNIGDGETSKNYLNQDCGDCSHPSAGGKCALINSYMFGLWVQAMKYYRNEVLQNEMTTAGQLQVHSTCKPLAIDYVALLSMAKTASATLLDYSPITLPKEVNQMEFCSTDPSSLVVSVGTTAANAKSIDLGVELPKNATCQLSAARQSTVTLFSKIAQCEIQSRVDQFFTHYAEVESKQLVTELNSCLSKSVQYGSDVGHRRLSESAGNNAAKGAIDSCVRPIVQRHFQNVIDTTLKGKFQTKNDQQSQSTQNNRSLPC